VLTVERAQEATTARAYDVGDRIEIRITAQTFVDATSNIETANIDTLNAGDIAYTGTLTGGTGVINIGSGQIYKDASGNVGVGTSSPAARLHAETSANEPVIIVQGNTNGSSTSGTGSTLSFRGNANAGNPWEIYRDNGASGNLKISVNNSGTRVDAAAITLTGQNFQFNSGYGSVATAYGCRAWVNFNGSNGSIRASGNVSSVARNAGGNYTVNFTSGMPDTNYSVVGTCMNNVGSNFAGYLSLADNQVLTSSVRVFTSVTPSALFDTTVVCVSIFR
jgi:hypothetical protein